MPPRTTPLTHFLCLPLTSPSSRPQLRESVSRFSAAESGNRDCDGVKTLPPGAVRPPGTIHFTIAVMSLSTPERIREACDFLQGLNVRNMLQQAWEEALQSSPELVQPLMSTGEETMRPGQVQKPRMEHDDRETSTVVHLSPASPSTPPRLAISLKDLVALHSPSKTSVLFARPDPQQPLLSFANALRDAFQSAEFLPPPTSTSGLSKRNQKKKSKNRGSLRTERAGGGEDTGFAQTDQPKVEAEPEAEDAGKGQAVDRAEQVRPPVLLHATIVNTLYAGKGSRWGGRNQPREKSTIEKKEEENLQAAEDDPRVGEAVAEAGNREKQSDSQLITPDPKSGGRRFVGGKLLLDARDLVERYDGFCWARDIHVDRVALCEMGPKKIWGSAIAPAPAPALADHTTMVEEKGRRQEVVDEEYTEVSRVWLP